MMVLTLIIIVDVLFKERKAMEKVWTEKITYVR